MIEIEWANQAERASRCPACHVDGLKRHLLDTTISGAEPVALLQCECGARYAEPIVAVDYHDVDRDGLRYYVEQGAGIVVMLEPFAALDERPIRRYLELGCGFGFAMEYARRSLGWEVLGFDPGQIAAEGKRRLGLPIEPRRFSGDADCRGAFDLVFCSEVIEHVAEPAGFLDMVRQALAAGGVLLMTTPDGDAVTPEQPLEFLLPVLSPSQHVVLYNAVAIETLLRRHGFADVRVRRNATQLQIIAATTPLGKPAHYFTRDRYRSFLENELAVHGSEPGLAAGIGYRLLCENVNAGRFGSARATYRRLRDLFRESYGYDIEAPESVPIPSGPGLSLAAFGELLPFNLCGVWYCRGIIALLDEGNAAAAARCFAASARVGDVLRAILNRAGTDDISLANFCRESEIARLSALARSDAAESLRAFFSLRQNAARLVRPQADAHCTRAARRLFADLTNLGHYALAEQVLESGWVRIDGLPRREEIDVRVGYGMYLLNHENNPTAASRIFAEIIAMMLTEGAGTPDEARAAATFQEVEIAQLTALSLTGRAQGLAALDDIMRNRGRLAPQPFAAHVERVCGRAATLFADLGYELPVPFGQRSSAVVRRG